MRASDKAETQRPKIVIVGGGFAGLSAAKDLRNIKADITVLDAHNYHLFQPLLYQVATAGLSPSNIAAPIRAVLRKNKNVRVLMAKVTGVDTQRKVVKTDDAEFAYDYLVLATGARHSYFGKNEWEEHAPGLKSVEDATRIRRRILLAFEKAESAEDEKTREALLTFVIVGGGPTGVEMAGAISELAHRALASDFRSMNPHSTRILLVEAGPRILASFDPSLSQSAEQSLKNLSIEVKVNTRVEDINEFGVKVAGGEKIAARTVIWAAGVKASPAGKWLGVQTDSAGRVRVRADLSVAEHPDVYVLGDTALCMDAQNKPLPGLAPVAMQQGRFVAKVLSDRVSGVDLKRKFEYLDKGTMATIGRSSAVAQLGKLKLSGFFAWVMWSVIHIMYLISFRTKILVLVEWMWAYVTFQRGSRLITSHKEEV